MQRKTGEYFQVFGVIFGVVATIGVIIVGISHLSAGDSVLGIVIMIVGTFFSILGGSLIQGFGELIDSVNGIQILIKRLITNTEKPKQAEPAPQNSAPVHVAPSATATINTATKTEAEQLKRQNLARIKKLYEEGAITENDYKELLGKTL